jgi:hypothetical protein
VRFEATLTVGQEMPKPAAAGVGAKGRFTATLIGRNLYWNMSLSNLSDPATGSYIRLGVRGETGPQLARLCGPCGPHTTGKAALSTAMIADLVAGKAYVNVGTPMNQAGEIRGQIHKA